MPPQQEHTAFRVVDDRARRLVRQAHDVVFEALAAGNLDVDQDEANPVAVVQNSLSVYLPAHRPRVRDVTGVTRI